MSILVKEALESLAKAVKREEAYIKNEMELSEVVVSIQNLVEFSRVLTEKVEKPQKPEVVRDWVSYLAESFEVIFYDEGVVEEALYMMRVYGSHFLEVINPLADL